MIVENLPALQRWLTAVLKPLCDADPEALTKYVVALLKKDVSDEVLRSSMQEQLEIFLQNGTDEFVIRLFDSIKSGEYQNDSGILPETVPVTNEKPICVNQPTSTNINTIDSTVTSTVALKSQTIPDKETAALKSQTIPDKETAALKSQTIPDKETAALKSQTILDKETAMGSTSIVSVSPSDAMKNNSQSSFDDGTSDEDRNKKNETVVAAKRSHWRNKRSRSPSSEVSPTGKRKFIGRTVKNDAWTRHRWSPIKRRIRRDYQRRRRSRSPLPHRSRHSPQNAQTHRKISSSDRSRSRSGSPVWYRKTNDIKCRPNPPSPESHSLLENITNKCCVKSVVVKPAKDSCNEKQAILASAVVRTRCVDFDEKGVCLRGELCPYDHGSDPVVLHEIVNKSDSGITVTSNFTGNVPCDKPVNFLHSMAPHRPSTISDEYYPENPSIIAPTPPSMPPFGWGIHRRPIRPHHLGVDPFLGVGGGMVRPSLVRHLGPPLMPGQRQLITVPVDGIRHRGTQSAMSVPENPFAVGGARMVCRALFGMRGRGRGAFDHSRLGSRPLRSGHCCLEVRKIPRELNNIESLINHFSKFGSVVSIQIGFDDDIDSALVTFHSHFDALNAYRSTDAVLNNRFIKVYWSKENGLKSQDIKVDSNNMSGGNMQLPEGREDKQNFMPFPLHLNYVSAQDMKTPALANTNSCNTAFQEKNHSPLQFEYLETPVQPITKQESRPGARAPNCQPKQEMVTLYYAQIQELKNLIMKYEDQRKRMTNKQKDEVVKMIKALKDSCGKLKTSIDNTADTASDLDQNANPPTNLNGHDVDPTNPESQNTALNSNHATATFIPFCRNHNGPGINGPREEMMRKLLDAELALYMCERKGHTTIDLEKKILQMRAEEVNDVSF